MPKIKIKRDSYGGTPPHLDDGELALDLVTQRLYAGKQTNDGETDKVRVKYADNSTYASKVGNEGSHPSIGYDNADGQGSEHPGMNPVYVNADGSIVAADKDHGSSTKPLYMDSGALVEGSVYAGGTKVTLNGVDKGSDDIGIYAPTSPPSSTGGSGLRVALCDIGSSAVPIWSSGPLGNERKPMFLDSVGRVAYGKEYHAPTTYGTRGQIAMSNGNNSDTVWSDCLNVPFVQNTDSIKINDNGIYAVSVRVTFAGISGNPQAYCTVMLAVTAMDILNWSSYATVYATSSSTTFANIAVYRESSNGEIEAKVVGGNTTGTYCELIGVYKLADTRNI